MHQVRGMTTLSLGVNYLDRLVPRSAGKVTGGALFWTLIINKSCLFFPPFPFLNDESHCSVTNLCPTLCDPMDGSMSGLPIPHHLPEFAQVYVHWIGDAIQPSHPLSPSSAFSLSLHQGLFQWVGSLYQLAKVLELQHQIKVLHPKCASQIFSQSMVAFLHAVFQKECLHLINSNLFIFSFMSLILLF